MEDDVSLVRQSPVFIETPRGTEIGTVVGPLSESQAEAYRQQAESGEKGTSDSQLHEVSFLGIPTVEQMAEQEELRREEESALVTSRRLLEGHQLEMKLVDVEYLIERKKLYLYFTSEGRIDFRAYVRDLAREFRTRIELRQIGARDEAKVAGGLGPCGRPCCCSYWLHTFMPIGIRMVKEQNLSLNPTKISGLCGRLMCCMSYEQSTYHEVWSHLPAPGSKVKNAEATYVLSSIDVARLTCQIKGPTGFFSIPVKIFPDFKAAVQSGQVWDNEAHGLDVDGKALESQPSRCCGCSCPLKVGAAPEQSCGEPESAPLKKPEPSQFKEDDPRRASDRRRRKPLGGSSDSQPEQKAAGNRRPDGGARSGVSVGGMQTPSGGSQRRRRPRPRPAGKPAGEGR